ncbi:MAG: hypothetical protein ABR582_10165 [Gemmatimonadaceae bacterium]
MQPVSRTRLGMEDALNSREMPMPKMGVTYKDARDITTYIYTLR